MVLKKNNFVDYSLSILGAFLYSIGHPTKLNIPPLGPLCVFIGFFLISYSLLNNNKKPFLQLCLTYLCLYFFSLDWLASSLKILTPIPYFLCYIICFFWTFLLVPTLWFPYLFKLNRKLSYLNKYPLIKNIIIPSFLFTFLENFLSFNLEIFIGSSWLIIPEMAKKASFFGPKYFSFLIFASVFSILEIYYKKVNPSPNDGSKEKTISLFLVALFLPLLIPSSLIHNTNFNQSLKIRVIQPNSSNKRRLAGEKGEQKVIEEILNQLINFSSQPTKGQPLDLTIWPEVAYPYGLTLSDDGKALKDKLPYTFRRYFHIRNTPLLFGGYINNIKTNNKSYQDTFNSALFLNSFGKLTQFYNKRFFVPFGEEIPIIGQFKWVQSFFTSTSYFASGETYPIFEGPKSNNFITVMCFEVLFTSFVRKYLNKTRSQFPSLIINLTNDSWLLNSAGPKHHLFLARWRALEFQIPIVRANNSGVSTIIYPDGTLGRKIPFDKSHFLDLSVKTESQRSPTIYQKFGDLPYFLFLCLLSFFGIAYYKIKEIRKSSQDKI